MDTVLGPEGASRELYVRTYLRVVKRVDLPIDHTYHN